MSGSTARDEERLRVVSIVFVLCALVLRGDMRAQAVPSLGEIVGLPGELGPAKGDIFQQVHDAYARERERGGFLETRDPWERPDPTNDELEYFEENGRMPPEYYNTAPEDTEVPEEAMPEVLPPKQSPSEDEQDGEPSNGADHIDLSGGGDPITDAGNGPNVDIGNTAQLDGEIYETDRKARGGRDLASSREAQMCFNAVEASRIAREHVYIFRVSSR